MTKRLISLILSLALILTQSGCDWGSCKNCNPEGTPFPTLEAEIWEGLEKE